MFTNFWEFLNCVKEARFTFDVIEEWINSVYAAITTSSDLSAIWSGLMNAVAPISRIFFGLLVVCLLCVAFFGRKIMGAVKFCTFFLVGFCVGTHFVSALLPPEINIPSWIIGLVVALISAVLSRLIYVLFYAVFFGYGTYSLVFSLFLLNPAESYTDTKAIVCLIIALAVTVVAFVFRKYVEMALTSLLGARVATLIIVNQIYNFAAWQMFGGKEWLGTLVATLLVAVLGFIVQVVTRRRY